MPFKSEKQRKFMWAKHPDIARRWEDEYGAEALVKKKHAKDEGKKRVKRVMRGK